MNQHSSHTHKKFFAKKFVNAHTFSGKSVKTQNLSMCNLISQYLVKDLCINMSVNYKYENNSEYKFKSSVEA